MKKIWMYVLSAAVLNFAACTEKNKPVIPNSTPEPAENQVEEESEPEVYMGKLAKVNSNYVAKPFSVSETVKVIMSQGNLQYQASTGTWQFAEDQYECLGKPANDSISATNSGWIDMFGWGTSGYNEKYPYMTNSEATDYGDGCNDIAGTNYDWGVYNLINNGGEHKDQWRTLTSDEWIYMFDKRANAANLRGEACVNEINGYILLPDDYVMPDGIAFEGSTLDWTSNVYSLEQWKKMEAAGAVFLPAAGNRYSPPGNDGVYWSSSAHYGYNVWKEWLCFERDANIIWFQKGRAGATYATVRHYGESVRLAQTVK